MIISDSEPMNLRDIELIDVGENNPNEIMLVSDDDLNENGMNDVNDNIEIVDELINLAIEDFMSINIDVGDYEFSDKNINDLLLKFKMYFF